MEHYRTGSHSRFDIKYHFVWITKYRKPILTGEVGVRLRELVREVCRTHDIKGKSSRKLMMEFKHIQKQYWGRHLWARGYFAASSGNVTDEAIMEYIRQQEGTEPGDGGDNFQIPKS